MDPKSKEVFFVRSFTRHRVLKRGWARGTRIKPAMEVVSVHYPHSFGRETGTWNNKTRGRASQRFPFGPWPFVAILGCCKQFKKATTVGRLHLVIYHYHHWLLYIWRKKSGRKRKSNLQNTTLSKNKKKRGNTNSAFEQFAIVGRIRRLLREEVDDKRGDLSTKKHQHQ